MFREGIYDSEAKIGDSRAAGLIHKDIALAGHLAP